MIRFGQWAKYLAALFVGQLLILIATAEMLGVDDVPAPLPPEIVSGSGMLLFVTAAIVAPTLESLAICGVMRILLRWASIRSSLAVLFSALVFSFSHGNVGVPRQISLLYAGMIYSVLYLTLRQKNKGFLLAWLGLTLLHAANNILAMLPLLAGNSTTS